MKDVPVIDLAPYFEGTEAGKRAVAAAVDKACREIGFLVIEGHGVPWEQVDEVFAATGAFFDLPAAQKAKFRPSDGVAPRGWHGLETKNLGKTMGTDQPPDLREQFYIGPLEPRAHLFAHIDGAAKFYQDNIWPDAPDELRPILTRWYHTMEGLATALMRIFALGLGMPEHYFDDTIDKHFATVPANFYPPPLRDPLPGQLRTGAHTDFGSLTILAMDDAPGGLQVATPEGGWRDVSAKRGQFIINIGDMMQRWTNDHWKSNVHRVVNPPLGAYSRSRRQTVGFFLHPNYDAEIACLPTCTGPDDPPRYAPILAGEHMRQKMEARNVP